jgi:hypothetical protein
MPFQNRVDPFSRLHAHPARGLFTGNRGCLHDDAGRIVRAPRSAAWLTCALSFKDRRRMVMAPGQYTHLFFLDEATALAAGHRPCAECRRADYRMYLAAIERSRQGARLTAEDLNRERAEEMTEALDSSMRESVDASLLPPGAMAAAGERAYLILEEGVRPWSFSGYGRLEPFPQTQVVRLTPRISIDALEGGYRPALHPSAPVAWG